jgi:hypothetical protein
MRLRIGLLGMSDNLSTPIMVAELAQLGRPLDAVFLQHPNFRGQWRRFVRKLAAAGPRPTLQRINFALANRVSAYRGLGADPAPSLGSTVHHVSDANSEHTRQVIRGENLDLLLVATDSLLGRGTFMIPRIATINAHPGWAPAYRGLGSITRMLRDGFAPAITVHIVDEGVDTGPVILREHVDPAIARGGAEGDLACCREQARFFAKAIALFEENRAVPIDTFLEPSSMSRGLPAAEARALYATARRRIYTQPGRYDCESARPRYTLARRRGSKRPCSLTEMLPAACCMRHQPWSGGVKTRMRGRSRMLEAARQALTYAGARCPLTMLLKLNSVLNYLWVGHWMRSRGFQIPQRVDFREEVFTSAADKIRDQQVLYLEFGVYRGESLRVWSRLLRNPESRLHGFDSFEGLPECWDLDTAKGHFTTAGQVPLIDDPRVGFFKGWFQDSLAKYVPPPHEALFVTLDADLYSSTKAVLRFLKPHIAVGTYLYFDEFQSREHELKAFDEFLQETKLGFQIAAANRALSHVLFQCTSLSE